MLKRWQFWFGVMISAVFLYLALRGLELDKAWLAMRTASYWWIIPGVVVYFFGVWARTWRWHYMLRPIKAVSLIRLFPVVVIGYMGNNVYPARAGELIRAYVLRKKEAVSISASLATIIVERIFDGVVMLLFVFVSLPLTPMPAELRQVHRQAGASPLSGLGPRLAGPLHGRVTLSAQRQGRADDLCHLAGHLAGRDSQVLVCDAQL
jgi:uncharacterized membrane protein YbhN (UPF0104 family)